MPYRDNLDSTAIIGVYMSTQLYYGLSVLVIYMTNIAHTER